MQGVYAKLVHPSQRPTAKSAGYGGSKKSPLHALAYRASRSPGRSNPAKSTHTRRSLSDAAPEDEANGRVPSPQVQSDDLLLDTHAVELCRPAGQRRAENRRANATYRRQVRDSVACGVPLVVTLKTNASGLVIELRQKWHAAIRSYAYSYLDYSQCEFGLYSQKIIEAIENRIAKKAFRYEPFPLQVGVVRKYLRTHIVETRSKWCQTWRRSGYKESSKPRSCPDHVWKSCVRFWKSTEGMEVSVRMSYARSCVQCVSSNGTVSNMSRMHELVIFQVHAL